MAKLFANDTIGPSISNEYQETMQGEHSCGNWGSSAYKYSGASVLDVLVSRPYVQTVLDFGAGKCTLEKFIQERLGRAIEWTNYDPGVAGIDVLPGGQFDCVVSTDVLEHVEPERLKDVLRTLADKTKYVLVSDIACYPTGKRFPSGPYAGQDMHLIIEQPEWWRDKIKVTGLTEFEYRHVERRHQGKTKSRCFMVHERV